MLRLFIIGCLNLFPPDAGHSSSSLCAQSGHTSHPRNQTVQTTTALLAALSAAELAAERASARLPPFRAATPTAVLADLQLQPEHMCQLLCSHAGTMLHVIALTLSRSQHSTVALINRPVALPYALPGGACAHAGQACAHSVLPQHGARTALAAAIAPPYLQASEPCAEAHCLTTPRANCNRRTATTHA